MSNDHPAPPAPAAGEALPCPFCDALAAKLAEAEQRIADFVRTFDGHVYVLSAEYAGLCAAERDRDALARQVEGMRDVASNVVEAYRQRFATSRGLMGPIDNEVQALAALTDAKEKTDE